MAKATILTRRRTGTTHEEFVERYEGWFVGNLVGKNAQDGIFPRHADYRRDYAQFDERLAALAPAAFPPIEDLGFHCITSETFASQEEFDAIAAAVDPAGETGVKVWDAVFSFIQQESMRPFLVDEHTDPGLPTLPRTNRPPAQGVKIVAFLSKGATETQADFRHHDARERVAELKSLIANGDLPAPIDYRWNYVSESPADFDCLVEITMADQSGAEKIAEAIGSGTFMSTGRSLKLATVDQWVGYGDDPKNESRSRD